MRAEEVYSNYKNTIRRLADKMRLPTKQNIQEKVFDREGNIDILFTASSSNIPDAIDFLNQITYELRGIYIACRIIPEGDRDIRMICLTSDKQEALELEKHLEPIRQHISNGLAEFGLEMLDLYYKQQEKLQSGEARTPREARRLMFKESQESGIAIPLLDIIEYFELYKEEHYKHIKKQVSEIVITGKKVTIIK